MIEPHIPTLMTVHAHPDDETIGTGGTMAKSVAAGRRVILVTGTRGEMGEIVVPDMDTPENHRRLGEIRAAELERAMHALAVTEWDNLGYRDSDMMGRPANRDPRSFWQADLDEAAGRLVWMIRRFHPDVVTTYNDFGGYGHPDHIRVHDVTVRAYPRAGDPSWYPEQLAPEHGGSGPSVDDGGLAPWSPSKLYEQAIPESVRNAMRERMEALGKPNRWAPPPDATPEQLTEFEAFQTRMLVPDESITTWVDISGDPLERKWDAMREHATQIGEDFVFMAVGLDAWRDSWSKEAFILRESTVETDTPEDDLFAGLVPAVQ
jgi:N-acetyl-1-D-myo-inositol-2-amino-2-deoxy-alpha-D-glucopyranoside deacetylase